MHIRVLDLDGAIPRQEALMNRFQPLVHDLRRWGPRIRLACRFRRFARFEQSLAKKLSAEDPLQPALTFYASGAFHHATPARLRPPAPPFHHPALPTQPLPIPAR